MVSKATVEVVGYIGLGGVLVGYHYFREPFMDFFWTVGLPAITVVGTPILAAGVLYLLLVVVVLRWIVGIVRWFFAA